MAAFNFSRCDIWHGVISRMVVYAASGIERLVSGVGLVVLFEVSRWLGLVIEIFFTVRKKFALLIIYVDNILRETWSWVLERDWEYFAWYQIATVLLLWFQSRLYGLGRAQGGCECLFQL